MHPKMATKWIFGVAYGLHRVNFVVAVSSTITNVRNVLFSHILYITYADDVIYKYIDIVHVNIFEQRH